MGRLTLVPQRSRTATERGRWWPSSVVVAVVAFAAAAGAAATPLFVRIAVPAEPNAIALGDGRTAASSAAATEVWDRMSGTGRVVRNVTRPTITAFLPDPAHASGAAVIVAPGGGFALLSMDTEGWNIGRWLADHGVAAFVLKYRLRPTPADEGEFIKQMAPSMAAMLSDPEQTDVLRWPQATDDVLRAVERVRSGAARWGVDPNRVGAIGFSAGAIATREAALSPDAAARPSFIGYIYGPMRARPVPADAPPMFAALANDDGLFGGRGFGIVDSWIRAKRPVELHAYERGNHGFGAGVAGTTTTGLLPGFLAWMQAHGVVGRSAAAVGTSPLSRGD